MTETWIAVGKGGAIHHGRTHTIYNMSNSLPKLSVVDYGGCRIMGGCSGKHSGASSGETLQCGASGIDGVVMQVKHEVISLTEYRGC